MIEIAVNPQSFETMKQNGDLMCGCDNTPIDMEQKRLKFVVVRPNNAHPVCRICNGAYYIIGRKK